MIWVLLGWVILIGCSVVCAAWPSGTMTNEGLGSLIFLALVWNRVIAQSEKKRG